ncbi:MAG: hemerythrin family protein [Rhodospirillales bacterium]|nr:hemerythrin family protein [Rhodospirillales bacterium]
MSAFAWTEAMSVGVPALDADHRCLVRIINLLEEAENDDGRLIETVINTLEVYCRYHFAREEQVMNACKFPALAFHRREHELFCRAIAEINGRKSQASTVQELLDYLKAWLLHHILIQDMAYKPFVADAPNLEELTSTMAMHLPSIEILRQTGAQL